MSKAWVGGCWACEWFNPYVGECGFFDVKHEPEIEAMREASGIQYAEEFGADACEYSLGWPWVTVCGDCPKRDECHGVIKTNETQAKHAKHT